MKWEEVRKLYPNKFVKVEVLESHTIEDKEYVDEVAVIKSIDDSKEAMREFVKCKGQQVVYSTKHSEFIMEITKPIGIRS